MNQLDRVKLAVIGVGHVAQVLHLPEWRKIPHVDVVAVCDTNKAKVQWVSERFGVPKWTTKAEEIFNDPEIDAVDICTDTRAHLEFVVAALAAGKHVLVEKPLARNYKEALEMQKAAQKYKRNLMVAMNVRFRRDAINLKAFIDNDELGEIVYVKCGWMNRRDLTQASSSWLYDPEISGGGVLMDLGIQMLDVSWWLLGNIKPLRVKANLFYRDKHLRVEDSAICYVHFENNSVLTIEVSWALPTEQDFLYARIYGTGGTATINPLHVYKDIHGNLMDIAASREESMNVRYKRSYRNELKHFIWCLRTNSPQLAGVDEVVERLRVVEAFYKSAKEGREVQLQ